jgi:hypothetical protein
MNTFTTVLLAFVLSLSANIADAAPKRGEQSSELAASIRATLTDALNGLAENGEYAAAEQSVTQAFDQVIAFAPAKDKALFRDATFAVRLVTMLKDADPSDRNALLPYLLENPSFARALVFLVNRDVEDVKPIFALANRLRAERGRYLDQYATLAAAICVVHETPFKRRINENSATAIDPLLIFDFYRANEQHMLFGIRSVPAELLVYVVDTTANIQEMQWALQRYAGDTNVGARFFDIEYDYDHFSKATPKKVTVAGWNLPNILQYGGVCADQAYFAMTMGKSIGVPTTYTVGKSSEVSHAWVGFLQAKGNRAWWNFNTGRYEAYRGVRGNVMDPQLRQRIPDSYISLLADFVSADELDRQFVAATNDAVLRMIRLEKDGVPFKPVPPTGDTDKMERTLAQDDQLELLEAGLRACPGYMHSWFTLRRMAEDGKLSLAQKKAWANVLHKLCGKWYPDFYLAIAEPMIRTVDDVREQNTLWNKAFNTFSHRKDLAASIRMAQAQMWLDAGNKTNAGKCYEDVILRYANDGPFVLDALVGAEKLLLSSNDPRRVLTMYDQAWASIDRPEDMAGVFATQSNWFLVGMLYADLLDRANMTQQAAQVRSQLGLTGSDRR